LSQLQLQLPSVVHIRVGRINMLLICMPPKPKRKTRTTTKTQTIQPRTKKLKRTTTAAPRRRTSPTLPPTACTRARRCQQMEHLKRDELYEIIGTLLQYDRMQVVEFCDRVQRQGEKDFEIIRTTKNSVQQCDMIQQWAAKFKRQNKSLFNRLPHISPWAIVNCAIVYAVWLALREGSSMYTKATTSHPPRSLVPDL
jgi:hypothetical protein